MLEFEKKIMLTKKEYCFLKEQRQWSVTAVVQSNHYYDTDDLELSRRGITCRIRERNGYCTATIKEHQTKWEDCSVENSKSVKDRYDDALFRNMDISYQGSLETVCSKYIPCPGVSVMLDRNSYLGIEDYELEIEYDYDKEMLAMQELDRMTAELFKNGILNDPEGFKTRIGRGKNKAARFFSRKSEIMRRTGGGINELRSE